MAGYNGDQPLDPMQAQGVVTGLPDAVSYDTTDQEEKKIVNVSDGEELDDCYVVNMSEEDENDLAGQLCVQLQKVIDERSEIDEKLQLWSDIYHQKRPRKDSPWENCANTAVPYPPTVVDTTGSRCHRSLFGVEDPIIVKPTNPNLQKAAEEQDTFINKHLIQPEGIDLSKLKDSEFFACGIDGTSIVKNPYVEEYETKIKEVTYNTLEEFKGFHPKDYRKYPKYIKRLKQGKPVKVTVEFNSKEYAGPKPVLVDLANFYASDMRFFNKSKVMAERLDISYDDLKEREERNIYHNIDKLIEDDKDKKKDIDESDIKYKPFEIFETIWKLALLPDKKVRKYSITLSLKKKVILRIERYRYNHNRSMYIPSRILPKQGSDWMGLSLIEIVENPSMVMDTMLNQMIDSNTMNIAQMFKVRVGGSFNSKIHKVRPGAVWPLRNTDDVQEFKISAASPQTQQLFGMVFQFVEQRTGVSVMNSGVESGIDPRSPGNKTIALLNEAIIRIEDYINRFRPGIVELITQCVEQIAQFQPEGLEYTTYDADTNEPMTNFIGPDSLVRVSYNIRTQAPDFNKQTYIDNLKYALDVVTKDPTFMSYPQSKRIILKELFKRMEIPFYNDIIPSQEVMDNYQLQMQLKAVQAKELQDKQDNLQGREMGLEVMKHLGMNQQPAPTNGSSQA